MKVLGSEYVLVHPLLSPDQYESMKSGSFFLILVCDDVHLQWIAKSPPDLTDRQRIGLNEGRQNIEKDDHKFTYRS